MQSLPGFKKTETFNFIRQCLIAGIVLLFFILNITANAQDPAHLQLLSNSLYVNPGFAGALQEKNISLNYRNQWPGQETKFEDFYASYDQPSELLHGGFGFYVLNDQAGKIMRNTSLAALYSYQLQVSHSFFVQAGFQVSLNQRSINTADLVFPDMIDPYLGFILPTSEAVGNLQKLFMDYSVGFVGFSREWFGGISVHHLTQPGMSENKLDETILPRKFTIFLGRNFEWPVGKKRGEPLILSPEFFFINQKRYKNLKYGVVVEEKPFSVAFHLRHDMKFSYSTLILSVGMNHSIVHLGYSYEVAVGRQSSIMPAGGTHEIGISIHFADQIKKNADRAIKLPSI